jgi:hypothetical protein
MLKDENELNIGDKVEYLQTYEFSKVKTALRTGAMKIIKGVVIHKTKEFVVVQTKNYRECFRYDEINKIIFKRGKINGRLKELVAASETSD